MSSCPDLLTVSTEVRGHAVIVHVIGEVDMTTGPELERELTAARSLAGVAPGAVVIDLDRVGFFGSAGLALLVATRQACQEQGLQLHVVAASQVVLRPLQVTGLDHVFDIVATVDDALRLRLVDPNSRTA